MKNPTLTRFVIEVLDRGAIHGLGVIIGETDGDTVNVWRKAIQLPSKASPTQVAEGLRALAKEIESRFPPEWEYITSPTGFDDWDEYLRKDGQWRPAAEERMDAAQPHQVRRRKA